MNREESDELTADPGTLSVITLDGAVEVRDAIDNWVVRFEPLTELPRISSSSHAAAQGIAAGLVEALPPLRDALRDHGAMRVVFSPEVRKAITNGSLRLMGDGALPVAVDQSGKIVQIATLSGVAAAGAGAGAGLGLGAAVLAAWPIVLAAGVATAAAVGQQRWFEREFANLSSQLERIETRLRDDDLGALDAADLLVDLVASVGFERVPRHLAEELAVTRRHVETIYFSRRRFVNRFKDAIEAQQTTHEAKTGESKAWAGDVAKRLADDGGAVDELVVFLRAMVSRARIGAITAGVLATDGAPEAALALLDDLQTVLRHDYWDLQNRLSALSRSEPDSPIWRRFLDRAAAETAHARAQELSAALTASIGQRLSDPDEALALEVAPGWQSK